MTPQNPATPNHMVEQDLNHILHALSNPTRRAIPGRLASGETTVGDLSRPLPLSFAGVSKHLGVLESRNEHGRSRLEERGGSARAWSDHRPSDEVGRDDGRSGAGDYSGATNKPTAPIRAKNRGERRVTSSIHTPTDSNLPSTVRLRDAEDTAKRIIVEPGEADCLTLMNYGGRLNGGLVADSVEEDVLTVLQRALHDSRSGG